LPYILHQWHQPVAAILNMNTFDSSACTPAFRIYESRHSGRLIRVIRLRTGRKTKMAAFYSYFPNYGEKLIGWIPEKDETIFKNV
jgi:hypothetical protein